MNETPANGMGRDQARAPYAVEVVNVSKRYGRTLALDDVSIAIRHDEVFALLGPNGAGKTTLIHILCTILRPDQGTAAINGFDVRQQSRRARRNLGVVFQEPSLDTRLTVQENLNFHGLVYEVPASLRKRRIDELLELVELSEWRHKVVRSLSSGMKRRVEIARALIHDAKVVILDEPTVGLDAQSRDRIWEYLRRLRQERRITLIITTHYIEEVDACDRVCIVDHGKVLALDTPEALKAKHGRELIRITPRDAETAAAIHGRFPAATDSGKEIVLPASGPAEGEAVLAEFGQRIRSISFDRPSLESVFLDLTGRDIRDRPQAERFPGGRAGRS